jgi:hypothetical protein
LALAAVVPGADAPLNSRFGNVASEPDRFFVRYFNGPDDFDLILRGASFERDTPTSQAIRTRDTARSPHSAPRHGGDRGARFVRPWLRRAKQRNGMLCVHALLGPGRTADVRSQGRFAAEIEVRAPADGRKVGGDTQLCFQWGEYPPPFTPDPLTV